MKKQNMSMWMWKLKFKKDYNWDPSTCTCKNSKYLKSIADTIDIACDEEIIHVIILMT